MEVDTDYEEWARDQFAMYNAMSEEDQLLAVNSISGKGSDIMYINNPSEAVQLAAIKTTRWAYDCIDNPTDEAKVLHMALWVM